MGYMLTWLDTVVLVSMVGELGVSGTQPVVGEGEGISHDLPFRASLGRRVTPDDPCACVFYLQY
jgi:hypothetical protein